MSRDWPLFAGRTVDLDYDGAEGKVSKSRTRSYVNIVTFLFEN